jgi:hypothetical protein
MNVVFHALASFGLSHLAARDLAAEPSTPRRELRVIVPAFVAGVLSHGLQHGYPIPYAVDPPLALLLALAWCACVTRRYRLLVAVVFLGAVLPDLVDLGPGIANRLFGWRLPTLQHHLFPWHWRDGSGSLYPSKGRRLFPCEATLDGGDNQTVSITNHVIVVSLALLAIASNRTPFRKLAKADSL